MELLVVPSPKTTTTKTTEFTASILKKDHKSRKDWEEGFFLSFFLSLALSLSLSLKGVGGGGRCRLPLWATNS